MERESSILDEYARPIKMANGKSHASVPAEGAVALADKPAKKATPRAEVLKYFAQLEAAHRSSLSYDAARSGTDLDGHWAHADALDADGANSPVVRHTLRKRSRYESGSNAYYDGILGTYADMMIGKGPKLRMLTGNRAFNQLVEREFAAYCERIQLRRKLWCMAYAYAGDGEAFGVLQRNPVLPGNDLDLMLIEAEQCQTPNIPYSDKGYIDGIKLDGAGNIAWYDILPSHPGGNTFAIDQKPEKVSPRFVLHWFLMKRPGTHRGIPALTSSMTCGAISRRVREAVATAAESAASVGALLTSNLPPAGSDNEADPVAPFTSFELARRTLMISPMGWDAKQLEGKHPNAQYDRLHRTLINEQARPISMPYNVAAGDSSTYSFASGKLDTLAFRAHIDSRRFDCNDLVLDKLFAAWFHDWTILQDRREIPPTHQWDWPVHQPIDSVAEAQANKTKLETGELSYRQLFTNNGEDIEDQLIIMAEDLFGEAGDDNVAKCRQILFLRTVPQHAIQYVAQIIGLATKNSAPPAPHPNSAAAKQSKLRGELELYEIGIRSGAIKWHPTDEARFRAALGMSTSGATA